MRKFVRRHRAGVGFAVTVMALLAATTVGAVVQARRLARARAVAVARQGQAEELIGFMLGDLRDKLTAVGRLDLLDAVGASALAYFAAVPESQLSDEELYRRAQALQQLGEVRMTQERLPEAGALMRRSLAISGRLAAKDSLNGRWQVGYAHSHFWAANVDWQLGNVDAALAHFETYVGISRRLIAHYPDSLGYREELVYALNNIGFAKQAKGDLAGAIASYRAGITLNEELARRNPANKDWQVSLGNLQNAVAVAERQSGDLAGARAAHDRELAIKQALLVGDSTNSEHRANVGTAYAYRGELRLMMGDVPGALADATAAQRIYARLADADPADATLQWRLAKSHRQVAQPLLDGGDAAGAVRELESERALLARLLAKNAHNQRAANEAILAETAEARALLESSRVPDAVALARRAAEAAGAAVRAKPEDIERHRAAGDAYDVLGDALARSGDVAAARDAWSQSLAAATSAPGADPQTEVLAVEADALLDLGRRSDAQSVVAELQRRGYREPSFVKRLRARPERTA
jgi:tetratricopeptide (TPR) repeat protein